jgi:MFS family permease
VLLVALLADLVAMVFGMPRALFPQLAQQTFAGALGAGPALGLLYAALPVGALAAGLFSGLYSRSTRPGRAVVLAVCTWGLAIVGFGLSRSLWVAMVFLAVAGAADMVSMVLRSTILQAAATDHMRGRMQGAFTVVVGGGPRLADLLHGTVGAAVGTTLAISGGGALAVVAMLVVVLLLPGLWRYSLSRGERTESPPG